MPYAVQTRDDYENPTVEYVTDSWEDAEEAANLLNIINGSSEKKSRTYQVEYWDELSDYELSKLRENAKANSESQKEYEIYQESLRYKPQTEDSARTSAYFTEAAKHIAKKVEQGTAVVRITEPVKQEPKVTLNPNVIYGYTVVDYDLVPPEYINPWERKTND